MVLPGGFGAVGDLDSIIRIPRKMIERDWDS